MDARGACTGIEANCAADGHPNRAAADGARTPGVSSAAALVRRVVCDRPRFVLSGQLPAGISMVAAVPTEQYARSLDVVRGAAQCRRGATAVVGRTSDPVAGECRHAPVVLCGDAADGHRWFRGGCARHARQRAGLRPTGGRPGARRLSAGPAAESVRNRHACPVAVADQAVPSRRSADSPSLAAFSRGKHAPAVGSQLLEL